MNSGMVEMKKKINENKKSGSDPDFFAIILVNPICCPQIIVLELVEQDVS